MSALACIAPGHASTTGSLLPDLLLAMLFVVLVSLICTLFPTDRARR